MTGCASCSMKEMGCVIPLTHPILCEHGKGMNMKLTGKLAGNNFEAVNQNHYIAGHHKIPRIWVLVADRHKARVFTKPDGHLEQIGEALPLSKHKPMPDNVLGRVFSSASHYIRHCITSRLDRDTKTAINFVNDLSAFLEQAIKENAFDRLVIAAPPKMLGNFRNSLTPQVQQCIIAEVNKDLTKMTERRLMEELNSIVWF